MRRVTVILLVSLASAFAASAARAVAAVPAPASPGCTNSSIERGRGMQQTIAVDGTSRGFILDVPDSVQPQTPVPLLFDFHGFGHSAAGVWQVSKFKDLAPRDGFITVYPDGLPVHLLNRDGAGWDISTVDGNRDLAFVTKLLDHIEQTYCVDPTRVFATGFSNGAFLSNVLACTMADRFAAVAPVGGGRLTVPCTPSRGVAVLIHHGRKDPVVDVEQARQMRDTWVEKNGCRATARQGCEVHQQCRDGAEVVYCEDDSEHRWPEPATDRIWEFFKAHPMPGKKSIVDSQ